MKLTLHIIVLLTLSHIALGQTIGSLDPNEAWVNTQLNQMSTDQKIGQLFMIRAHSDKGKEHETMLSRYVKSYHVGGLCFFQGDPETQARITNTLQNQSKTKMLIAIDGEWGLGMRFPKSTISFPRQLTLGAINDNDYIYQMGKEVAYQLKRIGVNLNFAPVVDVNNNPNNPVINNRSFGEDIYNVGAKSYAYMKGMQEHGVAACAKHFPGHGDTDVDSHYDLPVLNFDRNRLDSLELSTFKMMAELGIKSMMTAHLHVPSIDNRPHRTTSLSDKAIEGILRKELQYEGVVFTDALEMEGVAKHFAKGETSVEAFLAGNDVILMPRDLPTAFKAMQDAVKSGKITTERLNKSVRRILKLKYEQGLNNYTSVTNLSSIKGDLNHTGAKLLRATLIEKALTLVQNVDNLVPITRVQDKKFASLAIGTNNVEAFQKRLESYTDVESYQVGKTIPLSQKDKLLNSLATNDVVFVSLHDMSSRGKKNYGVTPDAIDLINTLSTRTNVVLTIFGSPYAIKDFGTVQSILVAYEESDMAQEKAAQALFGAFSIKGKLPVTASPAFPVGTQIITANLHRLQYDIPESVGISSSKLASIDSLTKDMIQRKAAPGCQILIAKDGKIVYDKAFGYHTYAKNKKVATTDLYDVASVTKILATTISLMSLEDNKQWSRKMPLKAYLPELDTTNKAMLIGEDVLAHHARLPGWIPFYKHTLDEDGNDYLDGYYSKSGSSKFCIPVSDNLYLCSDYRDSISHRIYVSDLRDKKKYKYSDIGFYLFKDIIEKTTDFPLDRYTANKFYRPLGLRNTTFNPSNKFPLSRIVPTEKDDYFRKTTVHGYVHDMGAAMLGGVGGHAGLFASASDLAVLMQMLLNGGSYGGTQYIQPETIKHYTTRYSGSKRRGLGFDMKQLDTKKTANMADEASEGTFGHLGFTGAAVWADPEYDLIFIFLANRTYPSMENSTFQKKNYRPKAMSIVYKAMDDYLAKSKK